MSDVTVKQLASVLGISADKLMEQLASAGIPAKSEDDTISNESKVKLLEFLRGSHGKEKKSLSPRKKVVLKRKSKEVLRVASGGSGVSKTKSINIEVKKKKLSTGPSQSEMEEIEKERRDAQAALAERKEQLAAEDKAKQAAEEARLAAEKAEQERIDAEAKAQAEKERLALEKEQEEMRKDDEAQSKFEAEVAKTTKAEETEAEVSEPEEVKEPVDEEAERKKRHDELVNQQVQKAITDRANRKKKEQAGAAANNAGPKGKQDNRNNTRYGRKQLHVQGGKSYGRQERKAVRPASNVSGDHGFQKPAAPVVKTVAIPENITVSDLAKELSIKASDIIKVLMKMGMMVTINQPLDQDTAILVVEELGHVAEEAVVQSKAEILKEESEKEIDEENAEIRPPVVTVMGHVDHGKTSLLDYIRNTKVTDKEAGGITQHIGAYHVTTDKGVISFIDTPGHAAFTAMRARGAQVTDIVILVVAANDGVMPQTEEGIQHAKAAGVPVIVAVNKIDLPEANVDKVKQDLASHEVVPEDWGGDVQFIEVSAHTGQGIDELLDAISLQAEVMELKAVSDSTASGIVVESSLDKGRGPVATVLVKNGTLKKGDMILCGEQFGRIRSLIDENGKEIKSAGPSIPAVVLGLSGVPIAGDEFLVVKNKKHAREAAQEHREQERETRLKRQQAAKLENLMSQMGKEEKLNVNLLVKADVQGSVEALRESLESISNDDVDVKVISSGVGGITNADAQLAAASSAIIIGFNVRADKAAREFIKESDLDLHYFSIIYEAIDQVKQSVTGILGTEIKEEIIGIADVRDVFRSSKFGTIAGCLVSEGVVRRDNPIRVLRDNVVIFEGELESLRRHKDDVKEVKSGTECGIGVKQYKDVQPGDQIECYERTEVQRTLD
ncbi:translation initiation factor IF-2 [Marinicella sp. S1101]|uniref:translation initiation factor IF-2 n=1 Tax=Marinicella marina TaxID=2996016 RepID=UPI002260DB85|nr:translation initiation factor IF-2 [Marinicella marina]MCX7552847.1 translation initiation factor IF-2 [Marinicella marina]MDJ1139844.1 translation initiation factor IF-2 [Marinicella marina]